MDKIATEHLFMLEFVIDNMHLDSSVVRGIGDVPGDTCVSVQFLDNPAMDICEDDFALRQRYSQNSSNVKSGKSFLFSLTPTQANEVLYQFDVYVTVFKKMQQCSSEKVQVGTSLISIVNLFSELIASVSVTANENGPTAKTLKDTFQIVNNVGQYVGDIGMYIRMSCFGKQIVTQFQMNLDDKSVLFKDKEGHSLYRYKKAGQNNGVEGKPSNVCNIPSCPARVRSTSCPTRVSGSRQAGGNSTASSPPRCYQEIGASMGANALKIRVHKDKKLEPIDGDVDSCTCSNNGRKNQSSAYGGGSCHNQEQNIAMRPGYDYGGNSNTPFSLKLGGCGMSAQNNVSVVSPVCTKPDGTQCTEISNPDRDVYVLRIGKNCERAARNNNVELELCTLRGPDIKPIPKKETRDTQWAVEDAGCGGGSGGKGGKGDKGGKGGKGGKSGKSGNDGNGDKGGKSGKSGNDAKGDKGGKGGKGGKSGNDAKGDKGGKSGNDAKGDKGGKGGKGEKNISKSGEREGTSKSSARVKADKKEYSSPKYGNPHIIGGSKPCRQSKSFSPCSSRAFSPPKQSSFCNTSAVLSCQSYGSLEPYKRPSGTCPKRDVDMRNLFGYCNVKRTKNMY